MKNFIIKNLDNILKVLYIFLSILFIIPSIIYLFNNGTVNSFESNFKFLLVEDVSRLIQTSIFLVLFILITIIYFFIIKRNKTIFKNIKQIIFFVLVVTILFAILLPFTSSDIFYYIAVGWLDSNYNQNPYYVTINSYMEQNAQAETDNILIKGSTYWGDQTVVYGVIWQLICKIFSSLCMGSVDLALIIFKLSVVLAHLVNTYLIYKITNKKIFAIIYGLNPFVLIEAIANVHNDIFVILFVLLSLYMLICKKILWGSILMLAIATCIKYFTIMLLPFIIIYYFRKELSLAKRFINCIKYAILFMFFVICMYVIYVQNIGILNRNNRSTRQIYKIYSNSFGFI